MRPIVAIAAAVLLASCEMTAGPDRVQVLGTVAGYNDDDPQITMRSDGRDLTVTIITYGGGCETAGETIVEVRGLEARITPFDYTDRRPAGCDRMLKQFVHRASLSFETWGTVQLTVSGIKREGLDTHTLSVLRQIELQPSSQPRDLPRAGRAEQTE